MGRPVKSRRVCGMPQVEEFAPKNAESKEIVVMTLDEYETIRLIDFCDYSQEECAKQMQVARTTVQAIYDTARKKLARVIVEGHGLNIKGGAYELCQEADNCGISSACLL